MTNPKLDVEFAEMCLEKVEIGKPGDKKELVATVKLAATKEGLEHFRLAAIDDQFDAGTRNWKDMPGPSVIVRMKDKEKAAKFPVIIGTVITGKVEQSSDGYYQLTAKLGLSPDTKLDGDVGLRPIIGHQWGEVIVTRTDFDLVDQAKAEAPESGDVPALAVVKQIEYQASTEETPEPDESDPIRAEAERLTTQSEPKTQPTEEKRPAITVVRAENSQQDGQGDTNATPDGSV